MMRKSFVLSMVFVFLLGVCFIQWAIPAIMALPGKKDAAPRSSVVVREIGNFHVVTPGIMRGAQPADEAFALLKDKAKVRTILNLRHEPREIAKEKMIVEGLGMKYISLPMRGEKKQSKVLIDYALSVIADKKNQPIFVHCHAGKDRTGLVLAALRMKFEGWSIENALQEMLLYGYDRGCCSNLEKSLKEWALDEVKK